MRAEQFHSEPASGAPLERAFEHGRTTPLPAKLEHVGRRARQRHHPVAAVQRGPERHISTAAQHRLCLARVRAGQQRHVGTHHKQRLGTLAEHSRGRGGHAVADVTAGVGEAHQARSQVRAQCLLIAAMGDVGAAGRHLGRPRGDPFDQCPLEPRAPVRPQQRLHGHHERRDRHGG
jgi:hypothetical protein